VSKSKTTKPKTAPSKPAARPAKKAVASRKPTPKLPVSKASSAPVKKAARPLPKKAATPVKPPAPPKAALPSAPAKPVTSPVKPIPAAKLPTPVAPPAPRFSSLPSALPAPPKTTVKKTTHVQLISEPIAPAKPPVISDEKPAATKSGALFYDSHMHTPLCKHAWGEPEEYAAQGVKVGLKGIIFTCHCPMPDGFWPSVRMADSEFPIYTALVQRAADAYRGKLDVCLGLESEYFPGYEKWIENLHQRADFHYILGAVHWQAKDYLSRYETGTIEGFRRTYFEHLAQSAETGLYDCLAHPDLVKNYHPDSWCFAIIKNTVATVLDRIAKTGVAMEINTSGLNKSYSEMNPGNEMLRMMAERKIPIVLGSDAHRAPRVGEHFATALNNLAEAGFEHVNYFQRRERIELKISDVLSSLKKAADANT